MRGSAYFRVFAFLLLSGLPSQAVLAQGILIPAGTYMVGSTAYILDYGNFTNNAATAAFTHSGLLTFAGTTDSIKGSAGSTFSSVTVNTSSTTTVASAGQQLTRILQCNGTLNAANNLTLLANSSGSALVDGSGSGNISGSLTMQGYLPVAYGYHYVSSPFTNATVGQFASQLNLAASFPNFYSYLENTASTSSGWAKDVTSANTLVAMNGYAANFGTATTPQTIFMTGTVSNSTQSLTLYNHNQIYTQGFNLVGNPYPSPIDWKSSTGWTKTNVDDALYFFNNGSTNQYTGTYSTYINGVSSNGAITNRNLIAALQGFFVHVTNGTYPVTATLACTNAVRTTTLTGIQIALAPKRHNQLEVDRASIQPGSASAPSKPLARLSASFADGKLENSDPAVIYFDSKKDQAFNQAYDALKLMNTDSKVPSVYFISADQQRLSILGLPLAGPEKRVIPLGLKLDQDGTIAFNVIDQSNLPFSHVYLKDAEKNTFTEFLSSAPINVRLSTGVYENRFMLVFSNDVLSNQSQLAPAFNVYSSKGSVYLSLDTFTGNKGVAVLYDMLGRQVYSFPVEGNGQHIFDPSLTNGVYILQLKSVTGMHSKNLILAR